MDDLELCLYDLESFQTIWKVSGRSKKCPDHPENVAVLSKILQNHLLCAYVAELKIDAITRFIRKVFATKILLSGKFSLFVTLAEVRAGLQIWSLAQLRLKYQGKGLNFKRLN